MADKVKCIINGKSITLSAAAFKVAKRFYGAISETELLLTKPVELSKPLIKPTMKPIIIKPPLKSVPEVKVPEVTEGDPAAVKVNTSVPDVTGDPVTEAPKAVVKKAPIKRKKK